ncbi:MAG: serine acetyltransferase [Chitinophagaceae bacterium]|nr:serine acetyltransferase [Oligoflexus sp.]
MNTITTSKPVGQSFFYDIIHDMRLILSYEGRALTPKNIAWALFACDAYVLLLTFRIRKLCKKYHIPFVNRFLRLFQTLFYAIELGIDITLDHGVYFVHTVGTVVGGDAVVGEGCVFFGNNTLGAARFQGSPQLARHVVVGAGVRIIGKIAVGEECFLGANAVVVSDIPARKVAVGIPARVIADNKDLGKPRSSRLDDKNRVG